MAFFKNWKMKKCLWSKRWFVVVSLIASAGSALLFVYDMTVIRRILQDCSLKLLTLLEFHLWSNLIVMVCRRTCQISDQRLQILA